MPAAARAKMDWENFMVSEESAEKLCGSGYGSRRSTKNVASGTVYNK